MNRNKSSAAKGMKHTCLSKWYRSCMVMLMVLVVSQVLPCTMGFASIASSTTSLSQGVFVQVENNVLSRSFVSPYSMKGYDKMRGNAVLSAKKKDNESNEAGDGFNLKSVSPGALLLSPFLLLFGLDIVANIAVITKRSLEVMFTGEYTVWNPFQ